MKSSRISSRRRALKLCRMRKTFGGPPKVLRKCPHCKDSYGSREMRKHEPACRKAKAQQRTRKKAA